MFLAEFYKFTSLKLAVVIQPFWDDSPWTIIPVTEIHVIGLKFIQAHTMGSWGPDGPRRERSGAGAHFFHPTASKNHRQSRRLFRSTQQNKSTQYKEIITLFSCADPENHLIQAEFNFPTWDVWRPPWSLLWCIVPLLCRRHSGPRSEVTVMLGLEVLSFFFSLAPWAEIPLGRVVPIATQPFLQSDCGSRAACSAKNLRFNRIFKLCLFWKPLNLGYIVL